MAKRRKKVVGYCDVGSHGVPFVCTQNNRDPRQVGQYQIYEAYAPALRAAIGPAFVRRVEIWIDAEPPRVTDSSEASRAE